MRGIEKESGGCRGTRERNREREWGNKIRRKERVRRRK